MKSMWFVGAAGAILVCAVPARPQAVANVPPSAPPAIREIQISSTRVNHGGGWYRSPAQPGAEPDKTFLEISRNGDGYHLGDALVDANLVAALANAMRAPANPEPTREDLGFTPAWLKSNASSLGQSFAASTFIGGKPIHQSAFELAFADPAAVDKAIPLMFQRRMCADCDRFTQSVEITIEFDDGKRVAARTSSEFPYMLPWRLQNQGKDTVAYNADISRAIAALMPEKSTNRSRLAGERLATQLGHILLTQEEHEVRLQEVESQTGGTLSGLRSRYSVESASIGNYGDPVLRKPEDENAADEQTLDLHLQASSDLSHNFFSDEVFLRYVSGNVVDADKFLANAPRFEKLVLSVPWLNRFVQEQSHKVRMRLSFVGGSSFSDAEMRVFAADMHAIGRDQLIPKVEAAKNQIAAVMVGSGVEESDWLIFPDGHMLLWRYWQTPVYGKPSLLKWSSSPPDKKPCAKLRNNFVGCVGMEISAEGNGEPLESVHKD